MLSARKKLLMKKESDPVKVFKTGTFKVGNLASLDYNGNG